MKKNLGIIGGQGNGVKYTTPPTGAGEIAAGRQLRIKFVLARQ